MQNEENRDVQKSNIYGIKEIKESLKIVLGEKVAPSSVLLSQLNALTLFFPFYSVFIFKLLLIKGPTSPDNNKKQGRN